MSKPSLWQAGVALASLAAVGLVFAWPAITEATRERTPLEQAQELRSIEPHDFGRDIRFLRWEGPLVAGGGATVEARYEGPWDAGGFEMTVFRTPADARAFFDAEKATLSTLEEVQEINSFPSEHCAKRGGRIWCAGHHGPQDIPVYFGSWVIGVDEFDDGSDAMGLLRTARKHTFRVFHP